MQPADIFTALFGEPAPFASGSQQVHSPIDGTLLGSLEPASPPVAQQAIAHAHAAFLQWRTVPPPVRGELVRELGLQLRAHKPALGALVTWESGKILSEGLGEVQEMIDICDFAVGLSRQLYGCTIASERTAHRMMETWHPLGVTGIITAFNFPVAVWAWNATLALVCGNSIVWKPSEKTPLTALACSRLLERAWAAFAAQHDLPAAQLWPGLHAVLPGGAEIGAVLAQSPQVPVLSATGSSRMGQQVGAQVAARFGRSILELGGNNAMIVTPSADLELAARAITFSAAGTAGQRCTTLRRLIVHRDISVQLTARLQHIYASIQVGHPLDPATLVGPLIDAEAFDAMQAALAQARREGGEVLCGGTRRTPVAGGWYAAPALVRMPAQTAVMQRETFAPILYLLEYDAFETAIALHNAVPQGLSSAIFTRDMQEAERFMSSAGSDCGIANVNIGTSGAEIGGAFGGEKATGGGREAGSDAWRSYMRRATNTINYGDSLPLAQGVRFDFADTAPSPQGSS
ncbi:aldehyde dehydrogenase family protein [Imbroritus primus]|uniref:Aldehyde dehydrogenase family protein n=1 Tax=Imbroritus primus TaxID=3058603 RepID=A0ACD3STN3_9BURK|nr:aldehyde dehydrogenase family protein [Burkholderiaceae bacterium PBA]